MRSRRSESIGTGGRARPELIKTNRQVDPAPDDDAQCSLRGEARRRRDEGETKAEGGQVPVRNRGQGFLGLIKLPGEQGPRGTGAVHLIEDGGSGAEHPMSVARVACNVERERERSLSESSRGGGPKVLQALTRMRDRSQCRASK